MADTVFDDTAVQPLLLDLQRIFGARVQCVAVYGGNGDAESLTGGAGGEDHSHVHTVAVVESLTPGDLRECAHQAASWNKKNLATPLLLTRSELDRSLDAFPLELSEIITHHRLVLGTDAFAGLEVAPPDVRRACEVQARSHLLHLREGFIEARGESRALAAIIQQSARPLRLLLANLGRLAGAEAGAVPLDSHVLQQVLAAGGRSGIGRTEAEELYPAYIEAVERIVQHIDGWKA